jgi:hypothetical protein
MCGANHSAVVSVVSAKRLQPLETCALHQIKNGLNRPLPAVVTVKGDPERTGVVFEDKTCWQAYCGGRDGIISSLKVGL